MSNNRAEAMVCRFVSEACLKNDLFGTDIYKAARNNDFAGVKREFYNLPAPDGLRLLKYIQNHSSDGAVKALMFKYLGKGM